MPELSAPRALLRAEGAALLVLAVFLYALLLAPDLGMLGYVRGTRLGAATYNLVHTKLLPAALALYVLAATNADALSLSLIWFAHIGMDRALCFGLKYETAFKDTHLGRV